MMKHILKVKPLFEGLEKICYSKEGDAGIDLRASGRWFSLDGLAEEIVSDSYMIMPNERVLIQSGICAEIPKSHYGSIRDRSGLALKHGLHVLGGVVDETYRGEIAVLMINLGCTEYLLRKNDRIAQIIICPYSPVEICYVDKLTQTLRGINGFGGSGER